MARGALDFVTAALPKVPICARKLGDRTPLTSILSAPLAQHPHMGTFGSAAVTKCTAPRAILALFRLIVKVKRRK